VRSYWVEITGRMSDGRDDRKFRNSHKSIGSSAWRLGPVPRKRELSASPSALVYASKCRLAAKRLWRRCDLSIGLPLVVMWKVIGVEGVEAGFHFIQVWIPSLASLVRLRRSTSSPLRGPQCCVARRQELQKVQSIICNITGQGASKRPDAVVKTTALTAAFAKMRCQLLHFRAFLQRAGEGSLYPRR